MTTGYNSPANVQRKIRIKNTSSQTMPGYGVGVITSATDDGNGGIIFNVRRPTAADVRKANPYTWVFNSSIALAQNAIGNGTRDLPTQALHLISDSITAGDEIGIVADQWYLTSSGGGVTYLSADSTGAIDSGHASGATLETIFIESRTSGGNSYHYPGYAISNIAAGEFGKVQIKGGDSVNAQNNTGCDVKSGDRITIFYSDEHGYWFDTCKCCTGDDLACCTTPLWVCVCDTHKVSFIPDGSTIIIDTTDCCSADCSVSSRVEITLSCTGSTITGSYTQYCDDGGGETSDSGTFNSASLSALCDTTTETGYLNAVASAIGFCNPDVSFYNYEPPCDTTDLSCGSQDLSGDNISSVTVTIAGIDATSDPAAGCDCSDFNGTHSMTLVSSDGTQGSWWQKTISSSCSPYFDNAVIFVFFGCPSVSGCGGFVPVNNTEDTGYQMQVYVRHGTEGTCYFEEHEKCFDFTSSDDPTSIDTGTVSWAGRTASMFPPCVTCFFDGDIFGNSIGSFTNVTVRVQTT